MKNNFPNTYPFDFFDKIKEDGAGDFVIENVFRISIKGDNNQETFLSSFLNKSISDRDTFLSMKDENYDIGFYSTSMISDERKAYKTLQMFQKYHQGPAILKGTIQPAFGPSMFTSDSRTGRKPNKHHIDWWLYNKADPSCCFEFYNKKGE